MNKAADENTKGPFNKYTSTYYGELGHFITSMNGIKQVRDKFSLSPFLFSGLRFRDLISSCKILVFSEKITS